MSYLPPGMQVANTDTCATILPLHDGRHLQQIVALTPGPQGLKIFPPQYSR